MRIKTYIITTLLVSLVVAAKAAPQVKKESLPSRARRGDDSAVSQMEQASDVQDLQSLLHDPNYAGKSAVRLSLARMGDRDVLQYFACRTLRENDVDKMQLLLRDDLDHIGGAFTIEIYRRLLDSDSRFLKKVMRERNKYSDVIVMLPSGMVLPRLANLLPIAEIPSPQPLLVQAGKDQEFKAKWRIWIDAHKDEILRLPPSAEGIKFGPDACSKF